jgi:hypothetical protein
MGDCATAVQHAGCSQQERAGAHADGTGAACVESADRVQERAVAEGGQPAPSAWHDEGVDVRRSSTAVPVDAESHAGCGAHVGSAHREVADLVTAADAVCVCESISKTDDFECFDIVVEQRNDAVYCRTCRPVHGAQFRGHGITMSGTVRLLTA